MDYTKYLITEEKMKRPDKKAAFEKAKKVIRSVKNEKQLDAAMKMIGNFAKMYDDFNDYGMIVGKAEKLYSMMHDQKDRLKHLSNVKRIIPVNKAKMTTFFG